MSAGWTGALALLHARGWSGELVDEACEALLEACVEGELEGRAVAGLAPGEIAGVLGRGVAPDEAGALCAVAEVHDRADGEGDRLRDALHDLDAFVDGL
jgi:hypothetical protein